MGFIHIHDRFLKLWPRQSLKREAAIRKFCNGCSPNMKRRNSYRTNQEQLFDTLWRLCKVIFWTSFIMLFIALAIGQNLVSLHVKVPEMPWSNSFIIRNEKLHIQCLNWFDNLSTFRWIKAGNWSEGTSTRVHEITLINRKKMSTCWSLKYLPIIEKKIINKHTISGGGWYRLHSFCWFAWLAIFNNFYGLPDETMKFFSKFTCLFSRC